MRAADIMLAQCGARTPTLTLTLTLTPTPTLTLTLTPTRPLTRLVSLSSREPLDITSNGLFDPNPHPNPNPNPNPQP